MIDVKQLQCFVALAEARHFGRAASVLNTTQPQLSRKLEKFEAFIRVRLLYRSSQRVALMAAGMSFYEDAKVILESIKQAESKMKKVASEETGQLTIGFSRWAGQARLFHLLGKFRCRFPRVNLSIDEVSVSTFPEIVRGGEVDVAIGLANGPVHGLAVQPLWHEKLTLAVSTQHPLAGRGVVEPKRLQELEFIECTGPLSNGLREVIMQYLVSHGVHYSPLMKVEQPGTLHSVVASNSGTAIVPASFGGHPTLAGVALVQLQDAPSVSFQAEWSATNENPFLSAKTIGATKARDSKLATQDSRSRDCGIMAACPQCAPSSS